MILDLEDSVAAPAKDAARALTAGIVRATAGRDLIVRVNPRGQRFRRFPQRRNPTLQLALLV